MKEEIEKILKESVEADEHGWFNPTEATTQLQKLFLSKQVELLDAVVRMDGNAVAAKLYELHYELKQLQ